VISQGKSHLQKLFHMAFVMVGEGQEEHDKEDLGSSSAEQSYFLLLLFVRSGTVCK